jgi:hypothetical protein
MSERQCRHPDVRKFEGVRCCLACGEAVFEMSTLTKASEPASMNRTLYKYNNLNHKLGQETRLVVIAPGETSDEIQCDIIHVNLEDKPDYEAVSYTWACDDGDATFSRKINCGHDAHMTITANCDAAIRQLRKSAFKRRLWIDAISINQLNVSERNHQVGLMDRVYSMARSVRICIHDPFENVFGYGALFRWLQHGSIIETAGHDTWQHRKLGQLLSLRYFKRVWVIQEVALAKAAYVLINGDELLLTSDVIDRMARLARQAQYELPAMLDLRHIADQTYRIDIIACLRAGVDCHCADPRDNVYAVLSLMDPAARSLIPIDYSLDCASVLMSAVVAVAVIHRNLDILSYFGCCRGWDFTPTLTQFKHFLADKDSHRPALTSNMARYFQHAGHVARPSQFNGEISGPWRAHVEIHVVDELQAISAVADQDAHVPATICRNSYEPTGSILPWLQVRAHFIDEVTEDYSHIGYVDASAFVRGNRRSTSFKYGNYIAKVILSCFRQTEPAGHMIAELETGAQDKDRIGKFSPTIGEIFLNTWVASSHSLTNDDDLWSFEDQDYCLTKDHRLVPEEEDGFLGVHFEDLNNYLAIARDSGQGNKMFTTSNSVGFARCELQKGDEIWAIDGARAPFVLRRTAAKIFHIIDECYLWAALELDYWNPGTGKGRLHDRKPAPYKEQTHIIEIH